MLLHVMSSTHNKIHHVKSIKLLIKHHRCHTRTLAGGQFDIHVHCGRATKIPTHNQKKLTPKVNNNEHTKQNIGPTHCTQATQMAQMQICSSYTVCLGTMGAFGGGGVGDTSPNISS